MSSNALILCVDDEPVNLTIMEELLQDRYDLATAKSGEGCLERVAERIPDLILLDVNMPDLDGLETCRRLKAELTTADIPIIFVSALASHEELMAGYEAGGDDYITKPFSDEILQKKINVVLASQRRKRELEQISDRAVEALQDTLSGTEALATVVRFLNQSHAVATQAELVASLFECLRRFELDSSLLIVNEDENKVWFSDDIDRPMESQILESLRGQDRVVSFGTRLAMNADLVTLLVRNLPSDAAKIERLREYLTILIEGVDDRLHGMQAERVLEQRRSVLAEMLEATHRGLGEIDEIRARQKDQAAQVLADMRLELEQSLRGLKPKREDKARLREIIDEAGIRIAAVHDSTDNFEERIHTIVTELSRAMQDEDQKEGE